MYSTLQRLNHLSSLSTTFVMILLGCISIVSLFTQPEVNLGKIDVRDLIIQKGRLRRWGAKEEELASLRFDIRADLNPLLNSYNTKQLFLYLTASYIDETTATSHDVVLWDRIVTRGDSRDIRAVGKRLPRTGKKGRGNVRIDEGKNKYPWREVTGSFQNIPSANLTLHYSLMPYVGVLSSGIAATASGPIELPEVIKR